MVACSEPCRGTSGLLGNAADAVVERTGVSIIIAAVCTNCEIDKMLFFIIILTSKIFQIGRECSLYTAKITE